MKSAITHKPASPRITFPTKPDIQHIGDISNDTQDIYQITQSLKNGANLDTDTDTMNELKQRTNYTIIKVKHERNELKMFLDTMKRYIALYLSCNCATAI